MIEIQIWYLITHLEVASENKRTNASFRFFAAGSGIATAC